MNVKNFIEMNKNTSVKWKIDGRLFQEVYAIPDDLLNKYVSDWMVNQWEGIIEITTKYRQ